jgi:hypothetical protein
MASALIKSAGYGLYVGSASYVFCRLFNHHNAFEKAVFVTVLVGLRNLAQTTIEHQRQDKYQEQPLTRVMLSVAFLLAIPCSLYAGRVFKFKEADYLHIAGLTAMGHLITNLVNDLYKMLPSRES